MYHMSDGTIPLWDMLGLIDNNLDHVCGLVSGDLNTSCHTNIIICFMGALFILNYWVASQYLHWTLMTVWYHMTIHMMDLCLSGLLHAHTNTDIVNYLQSERYFHQKKSSSKGIHVCVKSEKVHIVVIISKRLPQFRNIAIEARIDKMNIFMQYWWYGIKCGVGSSVVGISLVKSPLYLLLLSSAME